MAKTVKYKVPSKAASGAQTFADSLVGMQITDGTSQLTNTNFALDVVPSERDTKDFKTAKFSDFLTLETLKNVTNAQTTQDNFNGTSVAQEKIRFKSGLDDGSKSLYGSLNSRILVSITKIIQKFPAALYANSSNPIATSLNSATNISYSKALNLTTFSVEKSVLSNPFDLTFNKPTSTDIPVTINALRNFYSSYKNYVLYYNGNTYDIVSYSEPNDGNYNVITFKVTGKPFTGTTTEDSFLIRPNDAITEEFFGNLDDLESILLDRETSPIYNASFKVPRDSSDGNATELISISYNWPVANDGWNILITGIDYAQYIDGVSSIATEIDDYKSNIIVRFLTAEQLYEFDTDDQKMQSVFQLYGQSFDRIKKYIDNIAVMRNVTYDGINNVPDLLLKNLADNLGFNTVNLFDENNLDDILYNRPDSQYSGVSLGKNLIESENEFYRRLLVNLAYVYKSKGTKDSIRFFLEFLGAPDPLIKIDEYIYVVDSTPIAQDFQDDLYNLIQGTKINTVITGYTGGTYQTGSITGFTNLTREEYPIDSNGLPTSISNVSDDIFFQKGSGWYDLTLDHRSSDVIDHENSVLTGRIKSVKTIAGSYTYGEDYFDYFRTFPGLDYGFKIESKLVDNKGDVDNELSNHHLNRKNINIYLSPSQGIEYDIWRQSRNLSLTFGNLTPQTGNTFQQYVDNAFNDIVTNSNVIKYRKNYIDLETIFNDYITNTGYTSYDFTKVLNFIHTMSPYWVQVLDQFIPATTLWTGGNLITNNIFTRSKYKYQKPRYGYYSTVGYTGSTYNCP
jgi:hypothetical protein